MINYPLGIFIIIAMGIFLDIVTGITQAFYHKTLDSKILRNGMFHKLSYVFAIVLALFLEYACQYLDLGFEPTIFIPLAVYITITEMVSILENITRLNPELAESPIFNLLSSNKNRRKDDNDA